MRNTIIIFGVLYLWIAFRLSYNEAIEFKFTNAICESYNESWFIIHKCRLKAVNRTVNTMNVNGTILHPAYRIGVQLQMFKRANGYKPWLFNIHLDACRFIKTQYNPFAKIVFGLFKEFSNINHSCPYVGHQIVEGFYLRPKSLPHAIPSGNYLLSMTWYFDNRPQFITKLYFIYMEDL
ncbi:uncharacterized protein LOC133840661 [Drosophila sulfurigaster albostrigata]|uniref:uncharacterized protein LOC133840661 n=1 Tax=Drosophila sulfurigaster albostrigata TaxID=89887 RepID=UPI002D21CC7E|nr:uncharacterized protein LOC133840661 [Drosophila sulfurigaster albostrigata]